MGIEAIAKAGRSPDGRFYGLMDGKVEDIADPLRAGRLRVRVFEIHGGREDVPTEALAWARVRTEGGGLYDTGSAPTYQVGASVLVMFIKGNPRYPVVMGSSIGVPEDPQEGLTTDGKPGGTESQPDPLKTWLTPVGDSELPRDVFKDKEDPEDNVPTRAVWHKSFKGHTIVVEDGDGVEFIKILDRAGQVLEFSCPTGTLTNATNIEQRTIRDASEGTQLFSQAMLDGHAHIRFVDLSGQELILDATSGSEKILIRNRNRGGPEQHLEMCAKKGAEYIEILDFKGNQLKMQPNADKAISIRDYKGNEIFFDVENEQLTTATVGGKKDSIQTNLDVEVGGDTTEDYNGSKTTYVGGKLIETVIADVTRNVFGNINEMIGGSLGIVCAGVPASGSPSLDPLAGPVGFSLNTVAGGIVMRVVAPVGNLLLQTLSPTNQIIFTNSLCNMAMTTGGFLLNVGGSTIGVSPAGIVTIQAGGSNLSMTPAGVITLNYGVIPCNNLPVCLFTGAPHGLSPRLLVPAG